MHKLHLFATLSLGFALCASAGDWTVDSTAKTITDGDWTFNIVVADANNHSFILSTKKTEGSGTVLDFRNNAIKDGDDVAWSMVEVANSVFNSLSAVTEVQIPDAVAVVGNWSVYSMAALQTIVVSDNITTIGHSYLRACPQLTSASPMMPSKLSSLNCQGGYICNDVPNLTVDALTFGDGEHDVTFLNPAAGGFGSGSYGKLAFREGITSIPKFFRTNGNAPTEVTIPSTATNIVGYFYSLSNQSTTPAYSAAKVVRMNCAAMPTIGTGAFSGFKARTINFIVKYDAFNSYLTGKYVPYDDATHKADFESVFGTEMEKPTGLLNAGGTFCGNQWITVVRDVSDKTKVNVTASPLELGAVTPDYGTTECAAAVVSVPLEAPEYVVSDDYLYRCQGYATELEESEGVWSAPVTNFSRTGTFTTTKKEYARITWLWEKIGAKFVANANDGLGSVAISSAPVYSNCYSFGAVVTLTATKTGASEFAGWYIPSLPNGKSEEATINVTIAEPTAAFAYFPTTWHHDGDCLYGNGWQVRMESAQTAGAYNLRMLQSAYPCATAVTPGAAVLDFKNLAIDDGSVVVGVNASTLSGSSYDTGTRDALREVRLPNTVTNIGTHFCYNLLALREVEYPECAGSIGASAFRECPVLEEVVLKGALMDALGDRTLVNLPSLKQLTMPMVPSTIDSTAFNLGAPALQVRIVIPHDNSGGWQAVLDDDTMTRDLTRAEQTAYRQAHPDAKMALKILRKKGLYGIGPDQEQYLCHAGHIGTTIVVVR
ncbi:MAG: leucine-rich repeat protein [Kiritimatiellia bacterium]|jgi:hypothetical protein